MANKSNVTIGIISDASRTAKGFAEARHGLRGVGEEAGRVNRGFASGAGGILKFGAAVAVAGKLMKSAISATVEWAGQIRPLQRELGLSAEEASRLAFVAKHLGVEVEDIGKSFGILFKHLVANDAAVKKYGLSLKNTNGTTKTTMQLFGELQTIFQRLPAGPERTAAALALLGRGGKSLLPILTLNRREFERLAAETKKFGLELSGENLEAVKKYKFAQRDLNSALKGLQVQLGLKVLPILTRFFDVLQNGIEIFERIPGPIRAAGVGFVAIVGTLALLGKLVGFVKGGLSELGIMSLLASRSTVAGATQATGALAAEGVALAQVRAQLAAVAGTGAAGTATWAAYGASVKAAAGAQAGFLGGVEVGAVKTSSLAGSFGLMALKGLGVAAALVGIALAFRQASKNSEEFARVGRKWADPYIETAQRSANGTKILQSRIGGLKEQIKSLGGAGLSGVGAFFGQFIPGLSGDAKKVQRFRAELHELEEALGDLNEEGRDDPLAAFRAQLGTTAEATETFRELLGRGVPQEFVDGLKSMGDAGVQAADALLESPERIPEFVALWRQGLEQAADAVTVFAGKTAQEFAAWRAGTVEGFNGVKSALDDLASQSNVSAKQILKAFEDQLKAQIEYRANWEKLLGRGLPEELADQLQAMGLKGAGVVKGLADSNEKDFRRIIGLYKAGGDTARETADDILEFSNDAARGMKGLPLDVLDRLHGLLRDLPTSTQVKILTALETVGDSTPAELDRIMKNLGVNKNLRLKIIAAVEAQVTVRIGQIFTGKSSESRHKRGGTDHQGGHILHRGGIVPRLHAGGFLRSDERRTTLQVGEYVIQRKAVEALGLNNLQLINQGRLPSPATAAGASFTVGSIVVNTTSNDPRRIARQIADEMRRELHRKERLVAGRR